MGRPDLTTRELYTALIDLSGMSSNRLNQEYQVDVGELFERWKATEFRLVQKLHEFGAESYARRAVDREPSEQMYAVSRVVDVLLLSYQATASHIPRSALCEFGETIGATQIDESSFEPWFHEVTDVAASFDGAQRIAVLDSSWPGLMIGSMLVCRQGVRVAAPADLAVPGVADGSTLYWAHLRANRPTIDLSRGWGSNSRWHTGFRRDYLTETHRYFNVDARFPSSCDFPRSEIPLDDEEIDMLVRHRCSMTRDVGDDIWMWHMAVTDRIS